MYCLQWAVVASQHVVVTQDKNDLVTTVMVKRVCNGAAWSALADFAQQHTVSAVVPVAACNGLLASQPLLLVRSQKPAVVVACGAFCLAVVATGHEGCQELVG